MEMNRSWHSSNYNISDLLQGTQILSLDFSVCCFLPVVACVVDCESKVKNKIG